MRAPLAAFLLCASTAPLGAALADDVRPVAATTVTATSSATDDDDDPKRDHTAAGLRAIFPEHPNPAVKLSYRYFSMPNLDGSPLPFNAGQLDLYPISMRWFRVGIEAELGAASGTLAGQSNSAWYVATGLSLGVQYPARITPFVDFRFVAGLVGGDVAATMNAATKTAGVTYGWMTGLDFGAELYVAGRFFLTAAIGWVHPLYHGIDLAYSMAHPTSDPVYSDISTDAFTVKVGLGL